MAGRRSTAGKVALVLVLAAVWAACVERHDDFPRQTNSCVTCHGSADRKGSFLVVAAPPTDLAGNVDPSYPGVGAHDYHLQGAATHRPIDCAACHRVPTDTHTPGHIDSALPAEVELSGLASHGGHLPQYDGARRTCTDTYCHGEAEPSWTEPRDSTDACGSCHGVPPAEDHVQYDECFRCHVAVMAADGTFARPWRHVDGVLDVVSTCYACHGTEQSNAPPPDLSGSTDVTSVGVGAHEVHLRDSSRALAVPCESCHVVPEEATDVGHIDGDPGAEVEFRGVAIANGRLPTWDRSTETCSQTWCHGPSEVGAPPAPRWTSTDGPLSCAGCHGNPPPEPHPQLATCGTCHPAVADLQGKIIDRALHMDGIVQVSLPQP